MTRGSKGGLIGRPPKPPGEKYEKPRVAGLAAFAMIDAERDPAHHGRRPTHGLDMETKPGLLPERFQERVPADMTLALMAEKVETLADYARTVYDDVSATKNTLNLEAGAEYAGLLNACNVFYGELQGGKIRPKDYGYLPDMQKVAMKQRWANIVSGALTQINSGKEFADIFGMYDERGVMHRWMILGMRARIGSAVHTMKDWARMLAWEATQGEGETPVDRYRKVINVEVHGFDAS